MANLLYSIKLLSMDDKPIIKPKWIPAAYSGDADKAKVAFVSNVGGVPFYKRLREKNAKKPGKLKSDR